MAYRCIVTARDLSSLLFATVLNTGGAQVGDGSSDMGAGLAVDSSGNIYLAGSTNTNGGTSAVTAARLEDPSPRSG